MDGMHDNCTLGLDPLDKRNCPPRNAQATDRGSILEAQVRNAKTMLF
jgi:hypothetical protein